MKVHITLQPESETCTDITKHNTHPSVKPGGGGGGGETLESESETHTDIIKYATHPYVNPCGGHYLQNY